MKSPKIMFIGPKEAKEMLAAHEASGMRQRRLRETAVNRFASDMEKGRWMFTGQPIILNGTGAVLDGQHRLHAIIQSQARVQMAVMEGVPEEAFKAIDIGTSRSAGDILHISGHTDTLRLAAVAAAVWLVENVGFGEFNSWSKYSPSAVTVSDYVEQNPWLVEFQRVSNTLRKFRIAKEIAVLGVLTRLRPSNAPDPKFLEFVELVASGEDLKATHPAYLLRRLLINAMANRLKGLNRVAKMYYVVRSWNYFAEGRSAIQISGGLQRIPDVIVPSEIDRLWTAERVKQLRKDLGITMNDLASMLKVKKTLVNAWERDASAVHAKAAKALNEIADSYGFEG